MPNMAYLGNLITVYTIAVPLMVILRLQTSPMTPSRDSSTETFTTSSTAPYFLLASARRSLYVTPPMVIKPRTLVIVSPHVTSPSTMHWSEAGNVLSLIDGNLYDTQPEQATAARAIKIILNFIFFSFFSIWISKFRFNPSKNQYQEALQC